MRILHVTNSLDPSHGGPPIIAARIAAAQTLLEHDVTMLSLILPGSEQRVAQLKADNPHGEKVKYVDLPAPKGLAKYLPRKLGRQVDAEISKHDVVHLHGVWDSILRVAGVSARRQGKPYFILLNGMLDPWSLAQSKWKKKAAMFLGYRAMLRGAGALHLGNADEKELIAPLKLGTPGAIIPNGVFIEEIEPLPPHGEFYARHPELEGKPYILFMSRLHYKKGLDYLADAFAIVAKNLPEVRLVVAGPDGGALEDFNRRIAAAGVQNRTHVVGALYGPEKFAALVDASCFCLPSRQEGFSMAITEALAVGVPAVVSENCHFPEVAKFGAGEVMKLETSLVADALTRVMRDAALREKMSTSGRELVRSRYTWPIIAQQTIEMYQSGRKA